MLTSPQLNDSRESCGPSGDNKLHSWTSTFVKFHIDMSSTSVQINKQLASNGPDHQLMQQ